LHLGNKFHFSSLRSCITFAYKWLYLPEIETDNYCITTIGSIDFNLIDRKTQPFNLFSQLSADPRTFGLESCFDLTLPVY